MTNRLTITGSPVVIIVPNYPHSEPNWKCLQILAPVAVHVHRLVKTFRLGDTRSTRPHAASDGKKTIHE